MWRGVLVEAGLPADGATSLAQAFPLAPIRARSAVRRAVLNARLAGKDTATAADVARACRSGAGTGSAGRSEEHTSELQSLMRISNSAFCLKNKQPDHQYTHSNLTKEWHR